MVSTRGVRVKFSEGERVLCYEPDPTKAKVLYDSKVLEVVESKDKKGRRTVEYLIHFQGWNSSWDRCVGEDFVLKDTDENRQLQRDLAEKSQLHLGAYLYRRERKKASSTTSASSGAASNPTVSNPKRARTCFDDDDFSSSTQPDESEVGDTDSSSASGSGWSRSHTSTPPPHSGHIQIPIPPELKHRLTMDNVLIVKRGRLIRLPASPSVADILEGCVHWYARAGAWRIPRGKGPLAQRPDLSEVSCRLKLIREVADGLRVYFDFIMQDHLLYSQEIDQYNYFCGRFIHEMFVESDDDEDNEEEGDGDEDDEEDDDDDEEEEDGVDDDDDDEEEDEEDEEVPASPMREAKSPMKSPEEYAHLPPDPVQPESEPIQIKEEVVTNECSNTPADAPSTAVTVKTEKTSDTEQPKAAPVFVGRRLRSHKSSVSQSEPEDVPTNTTVVVKSEPKSSDAPSCSSSASSSSDGWSNPTIISPAACRSPLTRLLEKVVTWRVIPRQDTQHIPCRVYGAIHLARLFVKLPEFLNATHISEVKLRIVLYYVNMFVHYLNEHGEWFGDMCYYMAPKISRIQ